MAGGRIQKPTSAAHLIGKLTRFGWTVPVCLAVLAVFLPALGLSIEWQNDLILIAVFTLIASGTNLTLGYAGELTLGQVTMFATGAYVTGILATHGYHDLVLALICSAAAASVVGLLTGLPGLRLGHWSLALLSFFSVLLIPEVVQLFSSVTGGVEGLPGILGPSIFGHQLDRQGYYIFGVVVTALWLFAMRNLVRSRYGLALRALRTSPVLLQSQGISRYRLQMSAYLLGGLPAGIAGTIYAYLNGFVDPTYFTFALAVAVLSASIVGGRESVYGALLGAALLVLGPLKTASFQTLSIMAYGLFLLVVGVAFTQGITGLLKRIIPTPASDDAGATGRGGSLSPSSVAVSGKTLEAAAVSKSFGGNVALSDVHVRAGPSQITVIIGSNGAGKTTLLYAISGFISPDSGTISLDGSVLSGRKPFEISRAGVARTFQTPLLPESLNLRETIESGHLSVGRLGTLAAMLRLPSFRSRQREDTAAARAILAFSDHEAMAGRGIGELPLGTRRLVEVLRAVASNPSVILLDEPAAGLDGDSLAELGNLLKRLRSAGATIVLVEHNVPFVLGVADEVYVMDQGRVIASGTPAEVRQDRGVIESYLGAKLSERLERAANAAGGRL